jgi:hypothetical protein
MTRSESVFTPAFSSRLAPVFTRYIDLKRALGRRFEVATRTLQNLERFICTQGAKFPDLNAAGFRHGAKPTNTLLQQFGGFACLRGVLIYVSPPD